MDRLFQIIDKTGRKIYLPSKTWSHITRKHPYIADYLEEIKETIQKPDKITDLSLDEDVRYYYKYYKTKNPPKYLLTIVKYLNGAGFIISAYFTSHIK